MRVLIDIGHPAHVHFFRHPMRLLREQGHDLLVTSRDKEIAIDLLDELGIPHVPLSAQRRGGPVALGLELLERDWKLLRTALRFRPDAMAAIGGIFIAHVGRLTGIPSLVFYDTENARLQNRLTYPFASRVLVPRCYSAPTPEDRTSRYAGYHELSYLHPAYFRPDRELAIRNGLSATGRTYLVRLVAWKANHDVGERGWTTSLLEHVTGALERHGKVLISSEAPLPAHLQRYRYDGQASAIHHVMAFAAGFVGESATMASECAVLGVPAVYAATTGRGYTDEQESRYGLVRNVRQLNWPSLEASLEWLLSQTAEQCAAARSRLLGDTIDVARFVFETIQGAAAASARPAAIPG